MIKRIKISGLLIAYFLLCVYFNYFTIFVALCCSLFVHEAGHIVFIKIFKGKIKDISISIFGGKINFSVFNKRLFPTLLINFGRNFR